MQKGRKKRRLFWTIAALVLLLVLILSRVSIQNVRTLFFGGPLSPASYSLGDTSLIDGITVRQGADSVVIAREPHGWVIQGKEAVAEAISNFLGAFQQVNVYSPIPRLVDSLLEANLMGKEATVVTLHREGRPFKELHLLYTDTLGLGTVALARGNSSGAVIRTDDDGTKLFYLVSPNPSFWINSKLFTIPLGKITKVVFTNHQWPDSSFVLQKEGDRFVVLNYSMEKPLGMANDKAVSRFMIYLSRASVVGISSNHEKSLSPLYTINVESKEGSETVDYIPLPPLAPLDEAGHKALYNYNQLQVRRNGIDLYTANWMDVDLTIRTIRYFLQR